jgi:hypothetical protein
MHPSRTLLLALALAAACGTAQTGPGVAPHSRSVLTAEQIAAANVNTAYDALSRLQPGWLQSARSGHVGIFINGTMAGGVDFLHQLPASQIGEARYVNRGNLRSELSPTQAEGLTGAILIRTSRPRSP